MRRLVRGRYTIGAILLTGVLSVSQAGGGGKGARCDLDWTGQGATIVKLGGQVMVSQSPYVDATIGMRVENGGRVMTLDNSFAVVSYDDGCWHEMAANELLTIEDVSPCCGGPVVIPPPPVAEAAGIPLWPFLAGAAVIGGVIWALNDDDDDRPPVVPPPVRAPISP